MGQNREPGRVVIGLHSFAVMGLFFYANVFWIKGKAGCGIFCANVNRSTEIEEDNCSLLKCLE